MELLTRQSASKEKKKRVYVYLEDKMLSQLNDMCELLGMSKSSLISDLIERQIKQESLYAYKYKMEVK